MHQAPKKALCTVDDCISNVVCNGIDPLIYPSEDMEDAGGNSGSSFTNQFCTTWI